VQTDGKEKKQLMADVANLNKHSKLQAAVDKYLLRKGLTAVPEKAAGKVYLVSTDASTKSEDDGSEKVAATISTTTNQLPPTTALESSSKKPKRKKKTNKGSVTVFNASMGKRFKFEANLWCFFARFAKQIILLRRCQRKNSKK
jgi:predicted amidohydrolase YtcJ